MNQTENRNCPFCLCPIENNEDKVRCPKCGVAHHAECWRANGSCSVYGCDGWALWNDQISSRFTPETYADSVEIDPYSNDAEPAHEVVRCIICGTIVKPGKLHCFRCMYRHPKYLFENCFGPSILIIFGFVGTVVAIVKAIT